MWFEPENKAAKSLSSLSTSPVQEWGVGDVAVIVVTAVVAGKLDG